MNKLEAMRQKFPLGLNSTRISALLFAVCTILFLPVYVPALGVPAGEKQAERHGGTVLPPAEYYAAPTGTATGNGSITSPWDLKTALTKTTVISAGSTLWLRGGVYRLPSTTAGFDCNLNGTATSPIKVTSYPGEWAVIDGSVASSIKNVTILRIYGAFTWFMNFEVTNSDPTARLIPIIDSNPPERRGNSIDDYGTGTKIINLIIHDTGQGIGAWQQGRDNEYYGNIIYNNGWDAPDRTHGHANYVHNQTGTKVFEDNFFLNQFSMNGRTGGTDAANVVNVSYIGNVFMNGLLAWKGPNIRNFKVLNNYFYNNVLKIGDDVNSTYFEAEVRGNYAMAGVQLFEFIQPMIFEQNTVWNNLPNGKLLVLNHSSRKGVGRFQINNNTYYRSFMSYPYWNFKANYYGAATMTTPVRRKTGDLAYDRTTGTQTTAFAYTKKAWVEEFPYDRNSAYVDSPPTGQHIRLKINRYDSKRANLVIYNWTQATSVNVDVSSVLNPGDTYQLRNVQDYFGDVITGTYTGSGLQVSMIGRTRAKPIGYDLVGTWYHDPLQPNTFPVFGAFVLIKTN